MRRWVALLSFLSLSSVLVLLPGCEELTFQPRLSGWDHRPGGDFAGKQIFGPAVRIGRGSAQTVIVLGANLKPTSVGVYLSGGALLGLPSSDKEFVLPFPLGRNIYPFNHVLLAWLPNGHEPAGVYDVAHFDFHLVTIDIADRAAIGGGAETNPPASRYVPSGYVTSGESDPGEGVHYVNPNAPEFQPGGTFTRTMVFAFDDGRFVSFEPMVTLDYLRSQPNNSAAVSQSTAVQVSGVYPTSYRVVYDPTRHGVFVLLDNLGTRTAS